MTRHSTGDRLARDLNESHEIYNHRTGEWLPIASARHVTTPASFVRIVFLDETYKAFQPKQRIRSRIREEHPAPG
ncbi:hypothetical protein [Amycolatopsis sp. NPDC004079]|uniref:hypothetical protein n=1 Tax=Amycolatopsis sp. NPDC004079 TaxID=3154549 RepID=UPI0033B737CA